MSDSSESRSSNSARSYDASNAERSRAAMKPMIDASGVGYSTWKRKPGETIPSDSRWV